MPEIFAVLFGDADEFVDERFVVSHHAAVEQSQRYHTSALERGHVDDGVGFGFFGVKEGVCQGEPAFGVGVENFDRGAVHGGADIAGALGVPADHVFGGGDV